ncbi:hypothetical protein [Paenibacillus qinlingensis]|uniref:Uncharacterized protein n=1 Tax=Paenibacillus qinlingensis TaxID=1837343 RepID=A0ABU1NT34_9BACL|nr:hypothetical protein [Paenibacillus qinlingensis]MDR6550027.1 hypothetical protein [Paenibacillus qinlingensis]
MIHHRGIKLVNSVDMTNQGVRKAVDKLCDRLEETGFILVGAYHSTSQKIKGTCKNAHDIEIKPNDFVSKKAGCKTCHLLRLHGHEQMVKDFDREVKRHKLKQEEPLDFSKGILKGLKEKYLFTCPHGQEHYLSPYSMVKSILFQCHCGKC